MNTPIREFTRNIYSYIKKPGTYFITINSTRKLTVVIKKYETTDVTDKLSVTKETK